MLDSIQNSNTFFCPKSIDIEQCKKQWIYLSGTKYKLLDVFLSIVKLTGLKRKEKKHRGELCNYLQMFLFTQKPQNLSLSQRLSA